MLFYVNIGEPKMIGGKFNIAPGDAALKIAKSFFLTLEKLETFYFVNLISVSTTQPYEV